MAKPITKADMERMCRNGGLKPVARRRIHGVEVFVADGAVLPPYPPGHKFGEQLLPGGCYLTMWWSARGEDKLDAGGVSTCELFHDPHLSREGKQLARINDAFKRAEEAVPKFLKARHAAN